MKCFFHNEKDAVCQCVDCGKGMCSECGSIYNPPLCHDCATVRNKSKKVEVIKTIILGVVFFIGSFIFVKSCMLPKNSSVPLSSILVMSLIFSGIPWGWRTLNKITPAIFISLPIVGWLIYLMIKITLSYFIGLFVMVYQLGKIIYLLVKAKSMDKYITDSKG